MSTTNTVTVNWNHADNTYYLTDSNGDMIKGQRSIVGAQNAIDRASTLGTVVLDDNTASNLQNEKAAAKAADSPTTAPVASSAPATTTQVFDDGSTLTTDESGNVVKTTNATDTTASNVSTASSTVSAMPTFIGPYPNPLSAFPDYTYGITLWIISPDDYANLLNDPGTWTPGNQSGVIAASGGKYSTSMASQYKRLLPFFDLDFYFDDLKLSSSAAPTGEGKGASNSMEGSFKIIEPTGISFLDRITLAAYQLFGGASNIEVPYMLEVDFYGADNTFITQSNSLGNGAFKKRFPIRLSEVKVSFGAKGTEYACSFLPYQYSALSSDTVVINASAKVEGVRTVGDFFGSSNTADSAYLNDIRSDPDSVTLLATQQTLQSQNATANNNVTAAQAKMADSITKTTGLMNAINTWNYTNWVNGDRTYPDYYNFVIHPDIQKSSMIDEGAVGIKTAPMIPGSTAALKDGATVLDRQGSTYNVSAGTSIVALVDQVMRNSKYIQDQLAVPTDTADTKKQVADAPMNWYRIMTKVVPTQWDPKIGRFARNITYYIVPYTVYHTNHPAAAQTVPQGNPFKQYNYFYTGQNTEIIDCKLEFNTSYYNNVMLTNGSAAQTDPGSSADKTTENQPGGYPPLNGVMQNGIYLPVPTLTPRKINHITDNKQATSGLGGNRDPKTQTASSVATAIAESGRGDMLVTDLHIIGDPQYLKQDDTLWNPGAKTWVNPNQNPDLFLLTTGSLPFDGGEIYADIIFKSEIDFDPSTGLANPPLSGANPYGPSFSGRYRVLTIDSTFSKGKFEQVLKLSKYTDQEKTALAATLAPADRSSSSSATSTASATTTPAATPTATSTVNNSSAANTTAADTAASPPLSGVNANQD